MKKHIIFFKTILTLFLFNFVSSQEKEVLYLKYEPNKNKECTNSSFIKGNDQKLIEYKDFFYEGYFVFCNEYFKIKTNTIVTEINQNDIKNLNIKDVQYFIEIKYKNQQDKIIDSNKLFSKIFVIMPNYDNKFFVFQVEWKDFFIEHTTPIKQ